MRSDYGKYLRKFLSKKEPLILIDMGPGVFNAATVDTNIILIRNRSTHQHNLKAAALKKQNGHHVLTNIDFLTLSKLNEESWIILTPEEEKIKEKIERIGTPLKDWDVNINYGIKTGYNEAFIIDGPTKNRLIAEDPKSAEIIKPILRGRDIKRYKAEFADKWLINTHNGYKTADGRYVPRIDVNQYPAIKRHLDKYWKKIIKRDDQGKTPYNLRNCAYVEEFKKEKIVYNDINQKLTFSLSEEGVFFNNTVYFITWNSLNYYLLGVLNSKLIDWYYKKISAQLGEKAVRMFSIYVENLPIVKSNRKHIIEQTISRILKHSSSNTFEEDMYIDKFVYKLYELTYDEVCIIDPEFVNMMEREEYERFEV